MSANAARNLEVVADNTWPYRFDVLEVSAMFVDEAYQRPLSGFVRTIVDEFDPAMLGVLILSERKGGKFALVDGQTRWAALRQLGQVNAPALVYQGLSRGQEASLFARFQLERKSIRPFYRWRAELMSGSERAGEINAVCDALGVEVLDSVTAGSTHRYRKLAAINAVEKMWDKGGKAQVERVLTVLTLAWDPRGVASVPYGQSTPMSNELLRGLDYYLRQHPDADDDRLVTVLGRSTPTDLVKRASALREGRGHGGGSPSYMAEVIQTEYQRKARARS